MIQHEIIIKHNVVIYSAGSVVFSSPHEGVKYCNAPHGPTRLYAHRLRGPARISPDGTIIYYHEGFPHRTDGPAAISSTGNVHYIVHGNLLDPDEMFIKYGVV